MIDMQAQSETHAKKETSFAYPPQKASTESFRRPGGKPRSLETILLNTTRQHGSLTAPKKVAPMDQTSAKKS